MFLKLNDNRRININFVSEYKPVEKTMLDKTYFFIKLTYYNKEEDLPFYESEEKRNNFLKLLDKNLLLKNET